ncbi:protein FAM170A-like [Suricata suricatta]|uniref:protein FAM170A-like n=1 Tax=Suricata suricatta TaxID=37032 RepID=UPI001155CFC9|nr:protein FAM170A-like [Suricata suricatta]
MQENAYHTARGDSSSSSDFSPCISSENKFTCAEISTSHTYDPPSEYSFNNHPLVSEAKHESSESEYFTCNSSIYHHSCIEVIKSCEDSSRPGPSRLAQVQEQKAKDSHSGNIFCVCSPDKLIQSEDRRSHEDVPPHELCVSAPACSQAAEEKASVSEYFSCVSSLSKLSPAGGDGSPQLHQDASSLGYPTMSESSSPFPHASFPGHLSPAEATLSHVSMKEFPTDNESRRNHKAQEEREEVEGPAEPPAPQECSRPQTPEWLMALESGYKCMGCCRVFPTLDVLKQHVQNGEEQEEGRSHHVEQQDALEPTKEQ